MRIVIDTNFLFSVFWKSSFINKLLQADHDLYSPQFALEELSNHKVEILKKTKLTSEEFEEFNLLLKNVIEFIPFEKYSSSIPNAFELLPDHQKDIDFLALAISLDATILSKDKELKKQSKVRIIDEIGFSKLLEQ